MEEPPDSPLTGDFLTIGDAAPALNVAHWLKGREVTEFRPGRVYAISFWASWCRPCRASIPLLGELQQSYADRNVFIIGISDEPLQKVFSFLAQPEWNEKTTFGMATDPARTAHREYMDAAAIGLIPTVFLVGKTGLIEWIGLPGDLRGPLDAVLADEWDRDAFMKTFDEQMEPERERFRLRRAMKAAYLAKDWPTLLEKFDAAIAVDPRPHWLMMQKFQLLISEINDPRQGYAYGRELLREFDENARMLNQMAWFITTHDAVETRDLDLALAAARRACELTGYKHSAMLDTMARTHFERDEIDFALHWQRKAVEHLRENDSLSEMVHATLRRYEQHARAQR